MFDLSGKMALVTGASGGLGGAIARALHGQGAHLALSGTRRDALDALAGELGERAHVLPCDLSDSDAVEALVPAAEAAMGRLDILVNNAGEFFPAKFEELTDEQWDGILDINLKSQFLCAQAAAPVMKRQGRGRIINLTSLGGMLPWPSFTHYCVSKAGSIMLTRCLARALSPEILVNSVAPGTIQFPGEPPDEEYIRRVPLHRTGTGADIAGAVLYLATADFVTGQVMVVDGGRALV